MAKNKLDREEREILNAIEKGDWEAVKPSRAELQHYREIARNTLRKDERLNIRISRMDLSGIKARAAEEGPPYQPLIASLIHKYASGRLQKS